MTESVREVRPAPAPAPATAVGDGGHAAGRAAASPAPSIGRLTLVELRKMADTRAGRWLLAAVGVMAVVLVTARIFAGPSDTRTAEDFLSFAVSGVGVLLPVLGILAVTSEWSQRTALTTFALVPRRERVLAAKLLASVVITLGATVVSVLLAVLGNAAAEVLNQGGAWNLGLDAVLYAFLFLLLNVLMGVAFGALLLASGVAIVLFFLIPTVWSMLGATITALRDAAGWLDLSRTTDPLLTVSMHGDDWARLATSAAIWVLLPLAAGLIRVLRHEVK